jgi:hypothetical protein
MACLISLETVLFCTLTIPFRLEQPSRHLKADG